MAEPVLASIETYAKERVPLHQGEVKLRKALNYILNQMQYLKNYLASSELTCDNNFQICELLEDAQEQPRTISQRAIYRKIA